MQPPVPIDFVWQAAVEPAHRAGSAPAWGEAPGALLHQIEPVLGGNAEPDPTFFVESWTFGVTAASENYLRRHQREKSHESPTPAGFPSFSFVSFLHLEPAAAPANALISTEPARDFSVASTWREEEVFAPGPLTLEAACQLLGVTASSTREQIRAAYRRMASRYHPDRLQALASVDPQLACDRMASINEAYRLLCDAAVERSA